jgi:hypothetical protein
LVRSARRARVVVGGGRQALVRSARRVRVVVGGRPVLARSAGAVAVAAVLVGGVMLARPASGADGVWVGLDSPVADSGNAGPGSPGGAAQPGQQQFSQQQFSQQQFGQQQFGRTPFGQPQIPGVLVPPASMVSDAARPAPARPGTHWAPDRPSPEPAAPGSSPEPQLSTGERQPATVASPGASFGIAAGGGLQLLDEQTRQARLDRMTGLGVGWVRFDISWSEVQAGGPSSWDWSNYDRLVSAARARDLQMLVVLAYTPTWARTSSCASSAGCVPNDTQQFADFAKAAVERYRSAGVRHWEVWNEPNLRSYWGTAPDPASYTKLLRKASAAIKAADPGAVVLTGGLARAYDGAGDLAPATFLRGIYDAGGRDAFDVVADHPYSFPAAPYSGRGVNAWRMLGDLRSTMMAAGDGAKKIWLTEYGARTSGPGQLTADVDQADRTESDYVSEPVQAQMLAAAVRLRGKQPWLGPLFFYSDTDTGGDTSRSTEYYGFYRTDGSPKPAADAVRQAIAASGR